MGRYVVFKIADTVNPGWKEGKRQSVGKRLVENPDWKKGKYQSVGKGWLKIPTGRRENTNQSGEIC